MYKYLIQYIDILAQLGLGGGYWANNLYMFIIDPHVNKIENLKQQKHEAKMKKNWKRHLKKNVNRKSTLTGSLGTFGTLCAINYGDTAIM